MYLSRWISSEDFSRFMACRMSLSWEMSVPKEHAATTNKRTQYTWVHSGAQNKYRKYKSGRVRTKLGCSDTHRDRFIGGKGGLTVNILNSVFRFPIRQLQHFCDVMVEQFDVLERLCGLQQLLCPFTKLSVHGKLCCTS